MVRRSKRNPALKISKSHVERMLQELGLSYKRPKLHVKSDDPDYSKKKSKEKEDHTVC